MTHFRKNFEILFQKNSWTHRFTFCVQISRKSATGKLVKRCFFADQKVQKMRFSPPFCARLAEGAKSLQGSVPPEVTSSCNISFQSPPVCRSYSRKSDFARSQYLPSASNKSSKGWSLKPIYCMRAEHIILDVVKGDTGCLRSRYVTVNNTHCACRAILQAEYGVPAWGCWRHRQSEGN